MKNKSKVYLGILVSLLITSCSNQIDLQNENKIRTYVTAFYNSLELTKEENQDGTAFKKSAWKNYLRENTSYSKERLSNLTGQYHNYYNIKLLKIVDIKKKDNSYIVNTQVEYLIDEYGAWNNNEELYIDIDLNNKDTILKGWYDIKPELIINQSQNHYQGESSDAQDLYKALGRNSPPQSSSGSESNSEVVETNEKKDPLVFGNVYTFFDDNTPDANIHFGCDECDPGWHIEFKEDQTALLYAEPTHKSNARSCASVVIYKYDASKKVITLLSVSNNNVNNTCKNNFLGDWKWNEKRGRFFSQSHPGAWIR